MPVEEAFAPGPEAAGLEQGPRVGTNAWARQFRRSYDCALAARAEVPGTERSWAAVQACVRRGDFTHLGELVADWSDDLAQRPDAPALLMRVIAARGGMVREDVRLLREAGISVFDLKSAMVQPEVYKGKLVLFMAQLEASEDGALVLIEQARTTTVSSIAAPSDSQVEQHVTSGRVGVQTNGIIGSGEVSGGVRTDARKGRLEQRLDFGFTETGTMVLAHLERPTLTLTAATPAIFLAQFEGTRPASENEFVVTQDEAGTSRATPVVRLLAQQLVR
jgi:hypothetical protein